MARVTVEDCIDKVENRFDLVLLASHRARMVSSGAPITIDRDNDKNPVVALREIADETISPGDLKEDLIHSLQKYVEVDEPEPESVPLIGAAGRGRRRRRHRGHGRPHDRGRAAQGARRPRAPRGAAGARDRGRRRGYVIAPARCWFRRPGISPGRLFFGNSHANALPDRGEFPWYSEREQAAAADVAAAEEAAWPAPRPTICRACRTSARRSGRSSRRRRSRREVERAEEAAQAADDAAVRPDRAGQELQSERQRGPAQPRLCLRHEGARHADARLGRSRISPIRSKSPRS